MNRHLNRTSVWLLILAASGAVSAQASSPPPPSITGYAATNPRGAAIASAPPGAPATPVGYSLQPIVRLGDTVGEIGLRTAGYLQVGALNDSGQIVFATADAAGDGLLAAYSNGTLRPLFFAGPLDGPLSMNQSGTFVVPVTGGLALGNGGQGAVIAWDGMPADGSRTFVGFNQATINNGWEVAFSASFADSAGQKQDGLFFRPLDASLHPVAVQGQALPGLDQASLVSPPSVNDAGEVAFLARSCPSGPACSSASFIYLWHNGTITLLGQDSAPDADRVWVDSQTHMARLAASNGAYWHQLAGGKLTLAVSAGQEMPGGGKLAHLSAISDPDESDRQALTAVLTDGSTAAYVADRDGQLKLVLKSGVRTELGPITRIGGETPGRGVALNDMGQVALVVSVNAGPETLVLLTPIQP